MEGLVTEDLQIEVIDQPDTAGVLLKWSGRCAERYPQRILGPFFSKVLEAVSERNGSIAMDFKTLTFLNSSAITVIVHFLRDAHRKRVRQLLYFDPQIGWQKMTSDAVRALSHGDPLLEVRT